MKLHFLQTIWSDIIILQDGDRYAMVDTGTEDQFPMIRDYLNELGVRELEFILLTHFHCDHYGSIPAILEAFHVKKTYLKAYSGLDAFTSAGKPADDAYRADEMRKYLEMEKLAQEKSVLIHAEDVPEIPFDSCTLKLYNNTNSVRTIYEDASCPETWHRFTLTENQNSLAVWTNIHGASVFLGGDLQDAPSSHPLANYVNRRVAREIGKKIDLYKAPHHGTRDTATAEALSVYQPSIVIVTNGENWFPNYDTEALLRQANPDIRLYTTENQTVIAEIDENGKILMTGEERRL